MCVNRMGVAGGMRPKHPSEVREVEVESGREVQIGAGYCLGENSDCEVKGRGQDVTTLEPSSTRKDDHESSSRFYCGNGDI